MKMKIIGFAILLVFSMLLCVPFALAKLDDVPRGPPAHVNDNDPGLIYVTSQGMTYYTIVPYAGGSLRYNGNNGISFQPIDPTTTPASTPYGPGDPGYRGGRWWVDVNGNGEMDPEGTDHYFLCPLTLHAPGR